MIRIILLCGFIIITLQGLAQKKELELSRNQGIEYLKTQEFLFDYVFLYEYIRRGFEELTPIANLSEINHYMDSMLLSESRNNNDIGLQMLQYYRLVDETYQIDDSLFKDPFNLNRITLPALYCDQYKMESKKYFEFLKKKCVKDDYSATHVLLALIWLEENDCFRKKELADLKKLATNECKAILLKYEGVWDDITIESAALLQRSGKRIPKKVIREIIACQQSDGGWKQTPENATSSTHTTILAVMLIHNYLNK